jgi:isopentenyl-diphosphate delta-isomerase
MSNVLLLNENIEIIGISEKLDAHKNGFLHLAFSILILNSSLEMLIQKRAKSKYHSGGLWSNACCSHPTRATGLEFEIRNRLKFEMGIDIQLNWIFSLRYYAELDNELIENEFDHIYLGHYDGIPTPNIDEVEDWRWIPLTQIENEINNNPEYFTPWFAKIFLKFNKDYFPNYINI